MYQACMLARQLVGPLNMYWLLGMFVTGRLSPWGFIPGAWLDTASHRATRANTKATRKHTKPPGRGPPGGAELPGHGRRRRRFRVKGKRSP